MNSPKVYEGFLVKAIQIWTKTMKGNLKYLVSWVSFSSATIVKTVMLCP